MDSGGAAAGIEGALGTLYGLYGDVQLVRSLLPHFGTWTNQAEQMAKAKALGGPFDVPLTGAVPNLRIPAFATPGFAPGGGSPVTVGQPTAPPTVIPHVLPAPATSKPGVAGASQPGQNIDKGTTTMAFDLGNLLNNLVTTAGQVYTAQATHTNPVPTTPVNFSQLPVMGGTTFPSVVPQVGTTGAMPSTSHPMTPGVQYVGLFDSMGNLLGFKAQKRRKRRRQLVTRSDIAGIAELRAVAGPALTKEWIAVHGFR